MLSMENPLPVIATQGYVSGTWDSSVGIAMGYGLDDRGSIAGRGKTFFSCPNGSVLCPGSLRSMILFYEGAKL
jgi:hypothetical protein